MNESGQDATAPHSRGDGAGSAASRQNPDSDTTGEIGWPHIATAWNQIVGDIKPISYESLDTEAVGRRVMLAREHRQHSGSYRARSALWYLRAKRNAGRLPSGGIAVAAPTESSAAAWAWAAKIEHVPAVLFVPPLPTTTLELLHDGPVTVRVDRNIHASCEAHVLAHVGTVLGPDPHDPVIAAATGTWMLSTHSLLCDLATVVIPAGNPALELGTLVAARQYRINTVIVSVEGRTTISAAAQHILAGGSDLPGTAEDEGRVRLDAVTVTVDDVAAAQYMLRRRGVVVNAEGAAPVAALTAPAWGATRYYRPDEHEVTAALLAGPPADAAAADPSDVSRLLPRPHARRPGPEPGESR